MDCGEQQKICETRKVGHSLNRAHSSAMPHSVILVVGVQGSRMFKKTDHENPDMIAD